MINVTVWNEYRHELKSEEALAVYPDGIHGQIASFLNADGNFTATTATLDEPEHGLTEEVLEKTDVLMWWGHIAHGEVSDEIVERVYKYVMKGMGLIVLHSGHHSKVFKRLMGTTCNLKWREGDRERLWCINPTHPIAKGLPEYIEIENDEMYGEHFDIPRPDDIVYLGWFKGGEVFRSVCTFSRGYGKVVYIQPGHETNPTYYNEHIQQLIKNAAKWAAPEQKIEPKCPFFPSLEENK